MQREVVALIVIFTLFATIALAGCMQPPQSLANQPLGGEGNQPPPELEVDKAWIQNAVDAKDPLICENTKLVGSKYECFNKSTAGSTPDEVLCASFSDTKLEEICYMAVVARTKSEATCDAISKSTIKGQCFFRVAMLTKNSATCEKISDAKQKDYCKISVSKLK